MPPFAELPPITDERRLAVAQWVEANVRPVLHVVAEDAQAVEQPQQEFELRDYQVDAWANLDIAREEGRTRALGNLATGLGKTFVAAVDVMRYREWCAAQDPPMYPRILYVSHQKDINEQAAKTFRAVMPDADISFLGSNKKQVAQPELEFATIQWLYQNLDLFDPQDYEYIIWDESHHLEAETFKAVRDHFDPLFEHAITATVERMDGKDIQDYFGAPLYQKKLAEGIAEGHLADIDYHIVFDKAVKDRFESGFNPKTLEEIKELFDEKPPRDAIARNIEEEIERLGLVDPKTIVFCDSIDEAEEMAELLRGKAYHSRSEDHRDILPDFRSGRLRRITARDMLNEGVDIPDAELIVFLRSTKSSTIFEQQLGRGLRKVPGKDKVYVLDFVANVERITKMRELGRALQRRASELGQGDVSEDTVVQGDHEADRANLHIHTPHGDFDFDKIAVDILDKLGSLRPSARKTAEGQYSRYDWSPDDCTNYYRELCESLGRMAKASDIVTANKQGRGPGQITLLKMFGGTLAELRDRAAIEFPSEIGVGVDEQVTTAEVTSRVYAEWGEDERIAYYRRLSDKLGYPAGIKEIREASKAGEGPGPMTLLETYFDNSVFVIREKAGYGRVNTKGIPTSEGLPVQARDMPGVKPETKQWTSEELAEYYKKLSEKIGRVATIDDLKAAYTAGEGPSHTTVLKPFDNHVAKIRKAAGLKRSYKQDWEEGDFVDYYARACQAAGRLATARDINGVYKQLGGPDASQIAKLFPGGLTKLKELYLERNREE